MLSLARLWCPIKTISPGIATEPQDTKGQLPSERCDSWRGAIFYPLTRASSSISAASSGWGSRWAWIFSLVLLRCGCCLRPESPRRRRRRACGGACGRSSRRRRFPLWGWARPSSRRRRLGRCRASASSTGRKRSSGETNLKTKSIYFATILSFTRLLGFTCYQNTVCFRLVGTAMTYVLVLI